MPTERPDTMSQHPVGIMNTANLDGNSEDWRRAHTLSYLPSHLAWNTDATSLMQREKTYKQILEHAYDLHGYGNSRRRFSIKPRVNELGSFVEENPIDFMSYRESENDPLHVLRVQQPHLSREINAFYLRNCQIVIGDEGNSENILASYQWLIHIGKGSASRLQQLEIYTTPQELIQQSSTLLKIFEYMGSVHGYQDPRSVDLCIKKYAMEENRHYNCDYDCPGTTFIDISGMGCFVLQLAVQLRSVPVDGNVLGAVEDSFRANYDPYRRKATRDHTITWCFSRLAPRVDFHERLPPEIRILIHRKANEDYDAKTAAYVGVWSSSLHCHRNRLVSHLFAAESRAAFYGIRKFEFLLQEGEDYEDYRIVHGFLKLAGPEIVESLEKLTFYSHDGFQKMEKWSNIFSWLANVLVASTSTPTTSRELGSVDLLSWEVVLPGWKLKSPKPGDDPYFHLKDLDFRKHLAGHPVEHWDKFHVQLGAKFKVHLATNTVKPFTIKIDEDIWVLGANVPSISKDLLAEEVKPQLELTLRNALQGIKTGWSKDFWSRVQRLTFKGP
ncbi:MAG: hypothetical protein Q9160_006414 [Pyrenula sp. 1 TL-2023]